MDELMEGRYISSQFCVTPNIGLPLVPNVHLWVTLNRIRTGVGRLGSDCVGGDWERQPRTYAGPKKQTVHHNIYHYEAFPCDHQTPLMAWPLPVQPVLVGWSNLPLEGRCSYERR